MDRNEGQVDEGIAEKVGIHTTGLVRGFNDNLDTIDRIVSV